MLRVLVTASEKTRCERLRRDGGLLDEEDSAKAVRESDRARTRYLRELYDVRREEPTHYDLVINTDLLTPAAAAACVVAAAKG